MEVLAWLATWLGSGLIGFAIGLHFGRKQGYQRAVNQIAAVAAMHQVGKALERLTHEREVAERAQRQ